MWEDGKIITKAFDILTAPDCLRSFRKIHFPLLFKAVTFFSGDVLASISIGKRTESSPKFSSVMVGDGG